jgi:hypothetical protein
LDGFVEEDERKHSIEEVAKRFGIVLLVLREYSESGGVSENRDGQPEMGWVPASESKKHVQDVI